MEMLGLLGLNEEQDKTGRRSELVENLATGSRSTSKYTEVPRSTAKYLEVPQSM